MITKKFYMKKISLLLLVCLWATQVVNACHNSEISDVAISGTGPFTYDIEYCVNIEDGFAATTFFDIAIGNSCGGTVSLGTTSLSYSYNILSNPMPAQCEAVPTIVAVSGTATCTLSGGVITCIADDASVPIGPNPLDVSCCTGSAGQCGGGNPPIGYPDINGGALNVCFTISFSSSCLADDITISGAEDSNCTDVFVLPLPVELVAFNGTSNDEGNQLRWSTASEENTEFHIIERSFNGTANWEEIGRIPAVGTSVELQNYDFVDRAPSNNAYYRIKSQDFDLSFSYSPVVNVERSKGDLKIEKIFPIPAKENLNIDFYSNTNANTRYTLVNTLGVRVMSAKIDTHKGSNSVKIEKGNLTSGLYLLIIENDRGDVAMQKVIL